MVIAVRNFRYTYLRKKKPVFVPSSVGRRIGAEVKDKVEDLYSFDPMFFHLRDGGHVAAIHSHRDNAFFAKIDIENFFYSVSRRRVRSALNRIGCDKVEFYSKWSTVRNPFRDPPYSLPYGFVQSPVLATLVLATSEFGKHLQSLPKSISVSVYMDDIALSSNNSVALSDAFASTKAALEKEGFKSSKAKEADAVDSIAIFNCDLSQGLTEVQPSRIEKFETEMRSADSEKAFEDYCASVARGNWA
ncbi:MAG: reverse transcriptase domain-containing protein [Micropepsaceae bacterium]